jgi:hypothetical protein
MFPTIFIVDPEKIPVPKYVFAFDSGAFAHGLMDDFLHPQMPLFDFLLVPSVNPAARLVNFIFGGTEQYLRNQPRYDLSTSVLNFEAESYLHMATKGDNKVDDRRNTPEIIFCDPINLTESVRALIIPDCLMAEPEVEKELSRRSIVTYPYAWQGGTRPIEHHVRIRMLVENAYKDLG